jgi:carboxypeptidase T
VVSFTVELRPASAEEGGSIVPSSEIQPCWEENRPAAFSFIQRVLERPER